VHIVAAHCVTVGRFSGSPGNASQIKGLASHFPGLRCNRSGMYGLDNEGCRRLGVPGRRSRPDGSKLPAGKYVNHRVPQQFYWISLPLERFHQVVLPGSLVFLTNRCVHHKVVCLPGPIYSYLWNSRNNPRRNKTTAK